MRHGGFLSGVEGPVGELISQIAAEIKEIEKFSNYSRMYSGFKQGSSKFRGMEWWVWPLCDSGVQSAIPWLRNQN